MIEDLAVRNWPTVTFYTLVGLVLGGAAVVWGSTVGVPAVILLSMAVCLSRQWVRIDDRGLTSQGVLRRRAISWNQVERVDVIFGDSGWRLRLWHGYAHVDTFGCQSPRSLRLIPGPVYDTPPPDAPELVHRMYHAVVAKLAVARRPGPVPPPR